MLPFLQNLVALLDQSFKFLVLPGDAVGIALLVAGARIGGSLLDQLADIIADGVKLEQCIKKTAYENLHIITAGRDHKNPTELFDSPTISDFFEAAKFYYEMVIVDSAPIIPVSDPLILSSEVDGICLIVKAGVTQREVVTRACELIEQAGGARLLGVVMNNVKHALPYYYNHKYYGYQYHSRR